MSDKFTISLPVFDECLSATGIHEVKANSPPKVRDALEQFARYFKAEFHYDGVQYHANDHDDDRIGFLFTESALDIMTEEHLSMPTRCFGGCCFRKKRFKDGDKWSLNWVWMHPFFRRSGMLSQHWRKFRAQFGDFFVEPPVSSAMQSYLEKQKIASQSIRMQQSGAVILAALVETGGRKK